MRIAISAEDKNGLDSIVGQHFGRCQCFVLVDVEGDEVGEVQVIDNPFAEQHQPGMVPEFIHGHGADVMVSGGMGRRAITFFQEYGMKTATGASGTVRTALKSYLSGGLSVSEPCRESVEHDHD